MNLKLKLALAIAAAALLFLGSAAALAFIVWSGLAAEYRPALTAALADRVGLMVFVALLIVAGLGIIANGLFDAYVIAPQRLAEATRLIVSANLNHRIEPHGGAELQHLAREINALAGRYRALEVGVETRVTDAHIDVAREKNRLAALMSEIAQSVLVCNIEGRILLYNQCALQLLSAASGAETESDAAMAFGLGRSLFGVMDRNVVLHALEHIQDRLTHGDVRPVAAFVTTLTGGHLIRVHMAPVLANDADPSVDAADAAVGSNTRISGYVLTLEDIQRSVEIAGRRDRLLQSLIESARTSLASIRAGIETMLAFPDMEPARRQQFEQVIHHEAQTLSRRLDSTIAGHADCARAEWPLETMLARDLIAAVKRSIETRLGMSAAVEGKDEPVWLAVDSFSLVQALTYLAGRLKREHGVHQIRFRLKHKDRQVHLDLMWDGAPITAEAAAQWQGTALDVGSEATPLTFEDVIARHNGQAWLQSDAVSRTAYFRILLPHPDYCSMPLEVPAVPSRPVYYDFDLFNQPGQRPELDGRLLSDLSYTVFDTETTGLEPSAGDEIISIGAIRIVNGRLLHGEVFDQLIDPGRRLAPESARIHGIQPVMLEGQPTIARVLPRFHRFCEDTVLVAHNAAFDMRFLQLKEAVTGVSFTHPVLDTLMLSAVVHPHQREHKLEAIAERLGVNVIGRHTALGDAIVTGEIFLKLLPLLAAQGIKTLRDARKASQQTSYARVHY
jgi:DNA polymerase-3 subunit epsilon